MVEQTAYQEHEAALMQRKLMKQIFASGQTLSPPSFYLWIRTIEEIGCLSQLSEKLANRIRMILELK
jgi:uncharacterized protein